MAEVSASIPLTTETAQTCEVIGCDRLATYVMTVSRPQGEVVVFICSKCVKENVSQPTDAN